MKLTFYRINDFLVDIDSVKMHNTQVFCEYLPLLSSLEVLICLDERGDSFPVISEIEDCENPNQIKR
jgi:hypothetical protein